MQIEPEPTDGYLWSAVSALPERQRTAIVLRYVPDLKEYDIATVMGISRSTVSTTLRDARNRLESLLTAAADSVEQEPEGSDARPS